MGRLIRLHGRQAVKGEIYIGALFNYLRRQLTVIGRRGRHGNRVRDK